MGESVPCRKLKQRLGTDITSNQPTSCPYPLSFHPSESCDRTCHRNSYACHEIKLVNSVFSGNCAFVCNNVDSRELESSTRTGTTVSHPLSTTTARPLARAESMSDMESIDLDRSETLGDNVATSRDSSYAPSSRGN